MKKMSKHLLKSVRLFVRPNVSYLTQSHTDTLGSLVHHLHIMTICIEL